MLLALCFTAIASQEESIAPYKGMLQDTPLSTTLGKAEFLILVIKLD